MSDTPVTEPENAEAPAPAPEPTLEQRVAEIERTVGIRREPAA